MGAGAGKEKGDDSAPQAREDGQAPQSEVNPFTEMQLPAKKHKMRRDSTYLAERSQKRWSSKADGVLWGKLASLDKEDIGDIYLQGDVFSMGRDGVLCTYQLVNKLISSYHLELKVQQYGKSVRVVFVHDHSTNGSFVDGHRVGNGEKKILGEGGKLSLPWFSNGKERLVTFRYEPIKVVSDDWEPVVQKYTFGTITFEGTFTTYQLLTPKEPQTSGGTKSKKSTKPEVLTVKIIDMTQMQVAFSSKSAASMVEKEANLLQRLKHPNIAELRDSFMGKEYSFLIFRYPELAPDRAYDLSELVQAQWSIAGHMLRKKPPSATTPAGPTKLVSEGLVRVLVRQLVDVVGYIHSQDISHRNISPENCLLDYNVGKTSAVGVSLKLSNFGFASSFADNVAMQTKIETGHIDFCAPEMILQENGYGKEVDLWSVGVLTMMLLGGGRAPFRKESLGQVVTLTSPNSTAGSPKSSGKTAIAGLESGLSTAAVIENITLARFDFVPEVLWQPEDRSDSCKQFIRCLLVADPKTRASAEDLLQGRHSNWLNEGTK